MLFDKRGKKTIKYIWMGLGVLIIVSMLLLYFPAFFG